MQAVLYSGGLGDVIRAIYLTESYSFISGATEPVKVLCASHNPFALEIFRYHRNARQFILHDLGHKYEEFLAKHSTASGINAALCAFAGVDLDHVVRGKLEGSVPVFDAPDEIASSGHVVVQPFTGNVVSRVMPTALLGGIINVLRELPRQVFIVTRSYPRKSAQGRTVHSDEDARRFAGGNITVLENLTVPATLNLVKTCGAFIGGWSSLQQAAWFEHKPVAVFYPPQWCDVAQRTAYSFGLDRPETHHADWHSADLGLLRGWLDRWLTDVNSSAGPAPQVR